MKMLFKLYLLGQLIAMPFMLGAIGNMFDTSDDVKSSDVPSGITIEQYRHDLLCESASGDAHNSIQDEIQQLKLITEDMYGEDLTVSACPTVTAVR